MNIPLTTIENKWDPVYGVAIGALGLGLGGIFAIEGSTQAIPSVQQIDYGTAVLEVGVGVYGILNAYKFNKAYHFVLTKKE